MPKSSSAVEEKQSDGAPTQKRRSSKGAEAPARPAPVEAAPRPAPAPAPTPPPQREPQPRDGQARDSQGRDAQSSAPQRPQPQPQGQSQSQQGTQTGGGQGGGYNQGGGYSQGGGYNQGGGYGSQMRQGKRRKKKRNKGRGMLGPDSGPGPTGPSAGGAPYRQSISLGMLPSDEDLDREAAELERTLGPAKYKEAEKNALHLNDLKSMKLEQLHRIAGEEGIEDFHQTPRAELIFRILKKRAESGGLVFGLGTLALAPEGYGLLRAPEDSYLAGPDDIYVSPSQVRRGKLRRGMEIKGPLRAPKEGEKFFALLRVDEVNGGSPRRCHELNAFEDLTPLHPEERYVLETSPDEIEMRIVDLVAPVGKGQRGLIVAPPRTGKTVLLQKMTRAISKNNPDVRVIVLLIDERPEEVTDFRRNTPPSVEVIASTFDEKSARHVQVAEMVIEKARRAVEFGQDVVILLDSITRLARAYNNEMPHSGKIMTGGIDSGALQKPKKFFGAARAIEGGGSLTILATALVDTGSKADEVIFEEFKGTGNSELHLDRRLVEKRIWPAIDIAASGTRREELLLDKKELELVYRLRKVLSDMNVVEAMELMKGRLSKAKTNAEFLLTMNLG